MDDLRLTLELQDLRRTYPEAYAPPPSFLLGKAEETVARPEFLPALVREQHTPANVAVELLIANGQKAIYEGRYAEAETFVQAVDETLATGRFENGPAAEYLSAVQALAGQGYEPLSLDLNGEEATTQTTRAGPMLEEVTVQKVAGAWQVKDSP